MITQLLRSIFKDHSEKEDVNSKRVIAGLYLSGDPKGFECERIDFFERLISASSEETYSYKDMVLNIARAWHNTLHEHGGNCTIENAIVPAETMLETALENSQNISEQEITEALKAALALRETISPQEYEDQQSYCLEQSTKLQQQIEQNTLAVRW